MRTRRLSAIAEAVGGSVHGDQDPEVTGVSVDSRTIGVGDLFVALPGERVDGRTFVADALARGAAAAMVRRPWTGTAGSIVEVDDPAQALLSLAADERQALSAIVIGITGSTGKTCTKDMTASVLAQRFQVVASPASFNNEVGLPLTILGAGPDTEAVVCEMGSRGRGHITLLCEVARPDVGVVTNVGVAHMELFGSPEVLRDAKAELPEALPEDGVAVLNADDPVVRAFAARTPARRVVTFGLSDDAVIRAESVEVDRATGKAAFDLITPDGTSHVGLSVPGEHMVPDALAAAAVGWSLGVTTQAIADGLAAAPVSAARMQMIDLGSVRIVDDTYNANPTSVAAALKAVRWMAGDGRCIAVLGHMAELGTLDQVEHERVGELLARLGIDILVTVGDGARRIALGAEREGVEPDRIFKCDDVMQAAETVERMIRPGDLVLVKASRVCRLERVVEELVRRASADRTGSLLAEEAR